MSRRLTLGVSFRDAFSANPGRAFDGGAGSGMGADSAFEEMIRLRPVVHQPVSGAQSPPRHGMAVRRRCLG